MEAQEQTDGRRLASTVGTQVAIYLALLDDQVEIV
jgi:hypothetical protein